MRLGEATAPLGIGPAVLNRTFVRFVDPSTQPIRGDAVPPPGSNSVCLRADLRPARKRSAILKSAPPRPLDSATGTAGRAGEPEDDAWGFTRPSGAVRLPSPRG